jgi:hypothetical protein
MIDESDIVYVKFNDTHKIIGDGFGSKEEVVDMIKEKYENKIKDGEEIDFGVCDFNNISDSESEDILYPVPNNLVPMTDDEKEKLHDMLTRAEEDENINSAYEIDGRRSLARYSSNIRYENAIDFCLRLEDDVFDDDTISQFDKDKTQKIENIFKDLVGEEAEYLGFDSGYASRGRKNPYVNALGRVNRSTKKEKQFRELKSKVFVIGYYWNDLNLSPVPIYYNQESDDEYGYREQDYLIVIDEVSPDTDFDSLNDRSIDKVNQVRQDIEDNFDYRVDWCGKISHTDSHDQVCLGISFTGENERLNKEEYNEFQKS